VPEQPDTIAGKSHEFMVFAEYFQFYVHDGKSEADLSDAWDDEARARLLAIGDFIIGVQTVRDMDVAVTVEIGEKEPDDDLSAWDHVVQANLEVPSGTLVVSGPTEDYYLAHRITVEPGKYAVRVFYGMLDEVDDEGFEGDDFYRVYLWRSDKVLPVKILKQWLPPL
jgi:hypothetical protein